MRKNLSSIGPMKNLPKEVTSRVSEDAQRKYGQNIYPPACNMAKNFGNSFYWINLGDTASILPLLFFNSVVWVRARKRKETRNVLLIPGRLLNCNSGNRMNASVTSDSLFALKKIDALNALIAENDKVAQELNKCKIMKCALKNVIQKGIPGNPKLTEKLKLMIGAEDAVMLCQNVPFLGLEMDDFTVSLSIEEQSEVKPFLENEIKKLCQKILQYDVREVYGRSSTQQAGVKVIPAELSETVKERINCKLHNLNESLLKLKSCITDLLHLQQEVRLLREKENSWLSVTCEELELRAKILSLEIQMEMYSEDSYVVPATKEVSLVVERDYRNLLEELEELKKRKDAYDKLKGTEYDAVLEEYLQLKKEIDIKSWALNKLEEVSHT